jgi:2'-5' RNA ligase
VIRAFLAVELSQELRAELATVQQELKHRIEPEMKRDLRISWARPASIHLTLKFLGDLGDLGDMDEQVIDPLRAALEQAIGSQIVVNVPLERLGAFPRPQSPRVLWVGPSENWEKGAEAKRVAEIHGAIEQACEGLRFLRETKPFSPHLTLARIKVGERQVGDALAKSGVLDRPLFLGSLAVESVGLIKSELKPTGSVYTKLWEVRLSGKVARDM